jgi:hypothetical protein
MVQKSLSLTSKQQSITNMGHTNNEQIEIQRNLEYVLSDYVLPFREGNFSLINKNNLSDYLIKFFAVYKDTSVCNHIAYEVISATMNAKTMKINLTLNEIYINKYKDKINTLLKQVYDLEQKIRELTTSSGDLDAYNVVHIDAQCKVQSYNILNFLVTINPIIAWYYFLHGYNPTVGVDPAKYLEVRNMVISMGITIDPVTKLSPAAIKLREAIDNTSSI